jgi:hypothetical protein
VPLVHRIGSVSQTWIAIAVTRPALSALALLVLALFAGDSLPGLLAELAPPLDDTLGLMLMPAVAASATPLAALRWHAPHADSARMGRGCRDHAPRALGPPGRPRGRSRRRRASHGGARRSGGRGSRARPDPHRPGSRASCLLRSEAGGCGAVTHCNSGEMRAVAQAPAGRPRQRPPARSRADRRPGQWRPSRSARPAAPWPPGEVGGRGAAPRTTSPDRSPAPEDRGGRHGRNQL